jgi:hypothetical protein
MNPSKSNPQAGGLMLVAALVAALLASLTLVACPLAHDDYETDRPCWSQSDCVADELCGKVDGGELLSGSCAVPSDGPCGQLDAGFPGFYCFPDENGTPRSCYYDPQDTCTECEIDGGSLDCPPQSCVTWRGRYGCE